MRDIGVNAALDLGDALVDAAFGAKISWRDFFKQLLKDIAKAIIQLTIMNAIAKAAGSGSSGGGGGSGFANIIGNVAGGLGGLTTVGFNRGGLVGMQGGGIVHGGSSGRDSVPILASPGEAVLPESLTRLLMNTAEGGGARITIEKLELQSLSPADFKRLAEDNPEAMGAGLLGAIERGFI